MKGVGKLILIAAVDDRYGMMFHQRRQSQDRILREKILTMTKGKTLWMNAYSRKQFQEGFHDQIRESEEFLDRAQNGDYCFVEDCSVKRYADKISRIILYKWNRKYPGDVFFDIDVSDGGWNLVQTEDFRGSSHEKITMEVYEHE